MFIMKKLFMLVLAVASVMAVSAAKYVKVTSAPKAWDGEYILVYEVPETDSVCVFSGVDAANGYVAAKADTAKGVITGTFVTLSIISGESGDSIKVNGGDNDGQYITSKDNANGLKFGASKDAALMTITYESDNWVKILNAGGAVMRYNKSSGQNRFRMFKASTYSGQQPVQLYALDDTPTEMPQIEENVSFKKTVKNGQIVIIRNGEMFNLQGARIQ